MRSKTNSPSLRIAALLLGILTLSSGAWGQGMTKGIMSPPANVRPPGLKNVGIEQHLNEQIPPELTFYDEFTVAENLGFAGEAMGLDDARGRAHAALERVGLDARAGDRVAALSSGMKQRLRIAFALLSRPALLLLDEPGSHLDEAGRAVVARVIDEQRRSGLVLIATNDEREWRLAERRIELRGPGLGHSS